MFLAKVTFLKYTTDWFSYINLVLWQHVTLCKSYATESAPGCVCVCRVLRNLRLAMGYVEGFVLCHGGYKFIYVNIFINEPIKIMA